LDHNRLHRLDGHHADLVAHYGKERAQVNFRIDSRTIRDSEYISLSKAAELLNCSQRTITRAIQDGRLLTLRENGKVVTGAQLKNFIEAPNRVKSLRT